MSHPVVSSPSIPAGMHTWAILLAGGTGRRFSHTSHSVDALAGVSNKLLCPLAGQPVFQYALHTFLTAQNLAGVVVVTHPDIQEEVQHFLTQWQQQQASREPRPVEIIAGGDTRRQSVLNALRWLKHAKTQGVAVHQVMIHDLARPFVSHSLIAACLNAFETHPGWTGVVVGHPAMDTLKQSLEIENRGWSSSPETPPEEAPKIAQIAQTLPREQVWQVQTPQLFAFDSLYDAHQTVPADTVVTDDAQLIEHSGLGVVGLQEGPRMNVKLTTAEDWLLAEAWLKAYPDRVGL